jgi:hypothetical protein
MTWAVDPQKHEAMNEHGYVLRWANNKHGTWFNAYSPNGTHVDASYDKNKMQVACEAHRVMLENQKQMWMAKKASTEVV